MMINDLIVSNTQLVSKYRTRKEKAKKEIDQKNLDSNFFDSIEAVKQTVTQFQYAKEESDFQESLDVKEKLKYLMQICEFATNKEHIIASDTVEIKNANKELIGILKEEWRTYYKSKADSVTEILSIAQNISGTETTGLICDIMNAAEWNQDRKKITKMTAAVSKSNELIEKLELSPEIVDFLKKMIDHNASLADLTDNVYEWIEKEGVKQKIKLSF